MATYTLYRWGQRDTTGEGLMFATGRRTNWKATLRLGSIDVGSVEIAIQVAPYPDDDEFVELYTFGAKSAAGTFTATSKGETPNLPFTDRHLYVRGQIKAIGGSTTATFELILEGPWFDFANELDANLLTKEFRSHDQLEVVRILDLAERDVVDLLQVDRDHGFMEPYINDQGFIDAIKAEIAQQADWLFRREQLGRKKDATSQVTLRSMSYRHPDMGKRLQDYIPTTSLASDAWLGRG